jgi:hypothetical protein
MFSNIGQDAREGTDAQCIVTRNCNVMLSMLLCRQPHMTPRLPDNLIAKGLQQVGKCVSR